MARVIDLTAADGPDLLDRTTIEGRFRRDNLCAAPVGTYLEAGEVGRLLARNKSAGVTIRDGQAAEAIEPDSDYGAVCLLTDRRLLFVVGRADGDETVSLSLAGVVEAGTEPGLITDRLVVEATDGRTYTFPCLGGPRRVRDRRRRRRGRVGPRGAAPRGRRPRHWPGAGASRHGRVRRCQGGARWGR